VKKKDHFKATGIRTWGIGFHCFQVVK